MGVLMIGNQSRWVVDRNHISEGNSPSFAATPIGRLLIYEGTVLERGRPKSRSDPTHYMPYSVVELPDHYSRDYPIAISCNDTTANPISCDPNGNVRGSTIFVKIAEPKIIRNRAGCESAQETIAIPGLQIAINAASHHLSK